MPLDPLYRYNCYPLVAEQGEITHTHTNNANMADKVKFFIISVNALKPICKSFRNANIRMA
jgi:hypothetical protein